jgi:transposase-like protein
MKGVTRERWMELCAQAAEEQDNNKLLLLVREINDLLEAKEARLLAKDKATCPYCGQVTMRPECQHCGRDFLIENDVPRQLPQ